MRMFIGLRDIAILAALAAVTGCKTSSDDALVFHNQREVLTSTQLSELTTKANGGDSAASYRVYEYYEYVVGNYPTAEKWVMKSAEQGRPDGQYTYGLLLFQRSDEQSKQQGIAWLKKAAANGFKLAAEVLAQNGIK